MEIKTKNTAMARRAASIPCRYALAEYAPTGPVLDFGCGRGKDVEAMTEKGWDVAGYDPHWHPEMPSCQDFSLVLCSYVLNVIPAVADREEALAKIRSFLAPGGSVLLTVRSAKEISNRRTRYWHPYLDGWVTPHNTFQKGFTVEEITTLMGAAGMPSRVWRKGIAVFAHHAS